MSRSDKPPVRTPYDERLDELVFARWREALRAPVCDEPCDCCTARTGLSRRLREAGAAG